MDVIEHLGAKVYKYNEINEYMNIFFFCNTDRDHL